MDNRIEKILVSHEEIVQISKDLGEQISKDYAGKELILVGFLKGCLPFYAELTKHITIDHEHEFMTVSSYHGGTKSSGHVKIIMDIDSDISGKELIIVEDIVDTGRTIQETKKMLEYRGANVKVVTLLDKPEGRVVELVPDYVGKTIEKQFVVGFGLDYNEKLRNLPYIGILKKEVYGG